MKKMILRSVFVIILIILFFKPYYYVKENNSFSFLIDNSGSMKGIKTGIIKKIVKEMNIPYYTFGEKVKKNGKISFEEGNSLLDFSKIPSGKYLIFSDGFIKERFKDEKHILYPVFLEAKKKKSKPILSDFILPETVYAKIKNRGMLYFSNNGRVKIKITLNGDLIFNKNILLKNDKEILPISFSPKKGINSLKIYCGKKKRYYYFFAKEKEKKVAIVGKISPNIEFLRKYFSKTKSVKLILLIKIGNKFYYNGKILDSKPKVDADLIIAVGDDLGTKSDIFIMEKGTFSDDVYAFDNILDRTVYLQDIFLVSSPEKIYVGDDKTPILFEKKSILIVALKDFYKYYVKSFEIYDIIMKKAILAVEKRKKRDEFSFSSSIFYPKSRYFLKTSNKLSVFFNKRKLIPHKDYDGYRYFFKTGEKAFNLKIGKKKYKILITSPFEASEYEINKECLDKFADGFYLEPSVEAIKGFIKMNSKRKHFFDENRYVLLFLLLFLSFIWIWERK